jgi:hypothetical protein
MPDQKINKNVTLQWYIPDMRLLRWCCRNLRNTDFWRTATTSTNWRTDTMASTSTARPGPGPTEDLLLPGSIPLSKESVFSALAKASVWGKADKKKGVLLCLAEMLDTLLAKVGEVSQDQRRFWRNRFLRLREK